MVDQDTFCAQESHVLSKLVLTVGKGLDALHVGSLLALHSKSFETE